MGGKNKTFTVLQAKSQCPVPAHKRQLLGIIIKCENCGKEWGSCCGGTLHNVSLHDAAECLDVSAFAKETPTRKRPLFASPFAAAASNAAVRQEKRAKVRCNVCHLKGGCRCNTKVSDLRKDASRPATTRADGVNSSGDDANPVLIVDMDDDDVEEGVDDASKGSSASACAGFTLELGGNGDICRVPIALFGGGPVAGLERMETNISTGNVVFFACQHGSKAEDGESMCEQCIAAKYSEELKAIQERAQNDKLHLTTLQNTFLNTEQMSVLCYNTLRFPPPLFFFDAFPASPTTPKASFSCLSIFIAIFKSFDIVTFACFFFQCVAMLYFQT